MNEDRSAEVDANLQRADESLAAAAELIEKGHYDIAASRAYYAAFYAASAVLLKRGHEFRKHSAVMAAVHQHLVKPGKLDPELGKLFSKLFEVRGIGDYGMTLHVPEEEARKAMAAAQSLVAGLRTIASD
jgi:uncharacterized protein (UPF0332 family)